MGHCHSLTCVEIEIGCLRCKLPFSAEQEYSSASNDSSNSSRSRRAQNFQLVTRTEEPCYHGMKVCWRRRLHAFCLIHQSYEQLLTALLS